ncbi:homoserine kinase [Catellatospora sp. IY07-71]|uniref:homoserine kinase n=1 Tax=Catellatospora sp. IY07-71 TaxID=2728827 RepID=UPI001BB4391A|nr:homoserine kinase [Catellatospora sp. IY07-71]BCJ72601.1 homoserine kinase [Catellatospora sp. IY07-71]
MTISFPAGAYTVLAPATSANLGPGFDALGLALDLCDEVTAWVPEGGKTTVEVTGEGAGELPQDETHLIVHAMRETFAELGAQPSGLALHCRNRIPQARGLGSSSAAIVAGVTLANALAGGRLSRADEVRIAGRLEGHPDNIAPCLLGGFTIAWTEAGGARAVSLPVAPEIRPTVFVPAVRGLTAHARAALPGAVPHADASFNAGRSALLVHALTSAPDLLFEATEDRLHQNYRAAGMPETAALVARLREVGVAAVVSGAGPTVLALSALPSGFDLGGSWLAHTLPVFSGGARVSAGRIPG